jgi:multidrug efflux pump subunit AcrA (membrane-fusion protein)
MEAIRAGEARPTVMVVRDGAAQAVPLELGIADGTWVEVRGGLGERDQVILQGKELVKPGQRVRAVPATSG